MAEIPVKGSNHDWIAYRKLVLHRLDDLDDKLSSLEESTDGLLTEQINIRLDIRELRVRAAMWGGLAGGILGIIGIAIQLLFGA